MQGRRNRREGEHGIAPPDFGRLVNHIPTKVTPTEETIRENLIDSILHAKINFVSENPTNFLHHICNSKF